MITSRRLVSAASALFFVSGAAGLVYQVVWSRILNQIFGVSAHAVTAVLATYLGGIALGSWALGGIVDRRPRPLRLYGWLELGIALTAVGGSALAGRLDPVHAWAAARLAPDSAALAGARVLLAACVVLPPTVLMGATLPAMTRALVDRLGTLGRDLGFLYAVNTAGAVAGSLAAGFVLIRAVGVHPTLWIAAAVNAAAGVGALLLASGEPVRPPAPAAPAAVAPGAPPAGRGAWILAATALSGFASLAVEVLWTRLLVLAIGTSTYAFVTMLSTFLVGIAVGSLAARAAVDRLRDPRRAFGWIQVAIALSTLSTLPLLRHVVLEAHPWLDGGSRWLGATGARFGASFLVMFAPTVLIGTTLPLAARIWARSVDTLGTRLGQVYGACTVGNVVGAVAAGLFVLPAFGMQRGMALVTLLNLAAAGLALLPPALESRGARRLARALPIAAGLSGCAVLLLAWRPGPLPGTGGGPLDPVRYYREGLVSTVKVFQRASDARQLVMAVDGVTIGQSSAGVDRKQQVLAHLPFLLRADAPPRRVVTIGLGTGILAGEVARHPGVERVDCVELSPSVIEAAAAFAPHHGGVLQGPIVRVVNDDGVGFLRHRRDVWDAVISDGKSRSGHAGNALFYSEDYYRLALEHLAPDGVMLQWVPLDVAPDELEIIVRTFTRVFPHAYVWLGPESCFVAGLRRPLALDLARVQRALDDPSVEHLRRHGWGAAGDLAGLLVSDGAGLRRWVSDGPINSVERPVLEFHALSAEEEAVPRLARNLAALASLRRAGVRELALAGADAETIAAERRAAGDLLDGLALLEGGDGRGVERLERAVQGTASGVVHQAAAEAVFKVAYALDGRGQRPEAARLYATAAGMWPGLAEAHANLGRILAAERRTPEARAALERALAANPELTSAHRLLAELLDEGGDPAAAVPHLRAALRASAPSAELHERLGLSLAGAGRIPDALQEFREALRLAPDWPAALDRVAVILASDPDPRVRDPAEAVRLAERALSLAGGDDPMALEVAAASYAAAGRFGDAQEAQAKVVALAQARGDARLAAAAREVLDLYRRRLTLPGLRRGGAGAR